MDQIRKDQAAYDRDRIFREFGEHVDAEEIALALVHMYRRRIEGRFSELKALVNQISTAKDVEKFLDVIKSHVFELHELVQKTAVADRALDRALKK